MAARLEPGRTTPRPGLEARIPGPALQNPEGSSENRAHGRTQFPKPFPVNGIEIHVA